MMKKSIVIIMFLCGLFVNAQDYLGLEGSIPAGWSASGLSVSSDHYKMGQQSIQWAWQPQGQLTIENPAGMEQACRTYKGGMILWIYNENPQNADLLFEYLDDNNAVQYYFPYHLDFTGWRACWIRFDEDMSGSKSNKNLRTLRIKAPATSTGGTLFFDRMKFPSVRINDRVTPDAQLPFINPEMNANHWAALWHWHSTYEYEQALPAAVSPEELTVLSAVRDRITTDVEGSPITATRETEIRAAFEALNIQRIGTSITGPALVASDEYVAGNGDKRLKDVEYLFYDIAKGWYHSQLNGFDQMFVDMLDWFIDQGFAVGSGMGTNHHYGYDYRSYPKAVWLMQNKLRELGQFQKAFDLIQYWSGVPEIRQLPQVDNYQGIMDAWNTILSGRLMAVMMREDSPELVRDMNSFTKWVSATLQPGPGTIGGIKPDGAGFHHGMLYGPYANGGYAGLGTTLFYLGNSVFTLTQEGMDNLKKGLKVHAWYANEVSMASSVSGRHPHNQVLGTGAINAFGYFAKAASPFDTEMAAEFMRLTRYQNDLYNEFSSMGIQAAEPPVGNKTVNYGALNLHRRDDWLVAVKGFNKIVTGTEIYTGDNRYGRYQSYGTVQILGTGNPVSAVSSGYELPGWDWNRMPGATTIHLPFDILNYSGGNINERSDKVEFAGGNTLGDNGIFGMILDENNYTNYTDDFVARKSVFAFDNRIVCLGSNINNSNTQYSTETTLFQASLGSTAEPLVIDGEVTYSFPIDRTIDSETPVSIRDNKGNGYYIPQGKLRILKQNQESRDNKTKAVNYGNFASAFIDHGAAPSDAGYEYAILVQSSVDELAAFGSDMSSEETASYKVLRKDNVAHVVKDEITSTTGFVVFEATDSVSDALVSAANYPVLVMAREKDGGKYDLSLADPAINMEAPTTLVHTAEAKERKVQIVLNGRFSLSNADDQKCRVVEQSDNLTTLEFTVIHGLPVEVELAKEAPFLAGLLIDGSHPSGWTPETFNTEITIPQNHTPVVEAIPGLEGFAVDVVMPEAFPGNIQVAVIDQEGTRINYYVEVSVASSFIEDFENFQEDGWVNTSFVGNNDLTWYVNAKRDSHLNSGNSVYSFTTTAGVWSQPVPGGISSLSFEVKDLWAEGVERIIEVKINDEVIDLFKHTGTEIYQVSYENLNIQGDVVISIRNASAEDCAFAIDNIEWTGFAPDRNALLADIVLEGATLNGFDPLVFYYEVDVKPDSSVTKVVAPAESLTSDVQVTMPSDFPGELSVLVTAESGAWNRYVVSLKQSNAIGDVSGESAVTVYPVPAHDFIYLSSSARIKYAELYDLTGQLLKYFNEPEAPMAVSSLVPGLYLLKVVPEMGEELMLKVVIG
ncbi:chondroitinase family polysaccharide lyase [Marinilabilia salmonicolor]|jgi:chondroitin-sulfate-ABC endolyase/exolyase|uniref:Chondroitin-sulfate-ABC endolyase/exolyase n=1 Tax=Marinilabilia salmonicolor TaxID=989 RepID=A0A368VBI1_9BACT|nr:chondroitinase family polysaccharide lyase [Marinilabilia salmonicolor]RCW37595.1 chondroitin-sulfate-ABC endolyase/exolyase [Marinilabilia salmonicolor]